VRSSADRDGFAAPNPWPVVCYVLLASWALTRRWLEGDDDVATLDAVVLCFGGGARLRNLGLGRAGGSRCGHRAGPLRARVRRHPGGERGRREGAARRQRGLRLGPLRPAR